MNKGLLLSNLKLSLVGYALILASSAFATISIRLVTGYWPSLDFFTLSLVTSSLYSAYEVSLIVPLITAFLLNLLLPKYIKSPKISLGLSLSAYYLAVPVLLLAGGAQEASFFLMLLWAAWVFLLGILAGKTLEMCQNNTKRVQK